MRTALFLLLAAGCGSDLLAPSSQEGGVLSRVAVSVDSDVASVQLTATEVDCVTGDPIPGGAVHTDTADLLGMSLADFGLAIDPLSSDSTHDFTDIFLLVEDGCYDLVAQPLDADGDPSEDCSVAISDGPVEVVDGETTEVVLLATCDGDSTGGLDTIIAFNHAPTIVDFHYAPSKFTTTCVPVEVCAEAVDPNGDPLLFTWTVDPGSFTVSSSTVEDGVAIECILIDAATAGTSTISVTVQDLLADGTPIEDYLASIGNPATSHDSLTAPLHVSGVDGDGDGDGDGVCDSIDVCDPGDDTVDTDGDGVPDDCDICELGDDTVDADGDGIPDACDPCGPIEPGAFQWVDWDDAVLSGSSITGSVDGVPVTYSSSAPISSTASVFDHFKFGPSGWSVPNANPTVRNTAATQNTLTFASPVVDPVLVFASVGNDNTPLSVPVTFQQNVVVEWSRDVTSITPTGFTGTEGYAIVRVPGVHTQIAFDYLVAETYVNFVFGAAGDADADLDGDGLPDVCDPCIDDPDPSCQG